MEPDDRTHPPRPERPDVRTQTPPVVAPTAESSRREPFVSEPALRFELLDGGRWCGNFLMRRAAIEDVELRAAKRGQRVRWDPGPDLNTLGYAEPGDRRAAFVVRGRCLAPGR